MLYEKMSELHNLTLSFRIFMLAKCTMHNAKRLRHNCLLFTSQKNKINLFSENSTETISYLSYYQREEKYDF